MTVEHRNTSRTTSTTAASAVDDPALARDGDARRSKFAFSSDFWRTVRVYRVVGLGLAFYFSVVWCLAWWLGVGYKVSIANYLTLALQIYLVCLVAGVLGRLGYVMIWLRPRRLFRFLAADFGRNVFSLERLLLAVPVLIGMPVAMSVYSSLKRMIPDIVPFRFDPLFAEWDRALHFGVDPWRLLQPWLGQPSITSAISILYHQTWLALMILIWIWQAWRIRQSRSRLQFLITYLLVWVVLGNLGAVLLSSAGPPYFAEVTGLASPFVPLFDYLTEADQAAGVWALTLQDMLWQSHLAAGAEVGSGISAMPSVHVATTTVFVLAAWSQGIVVRLIFLAYAAVVLIGSVHLGWHYAIDGYISILATIAIWQGVGKALSRYASFGDA